MAIKNVGSSLVMGKIAEEEKIVVEDSEIDAEIDRMTGSVAEDKRDELRKMMDTPQTRESIKPSLLMRKTIERLVAMAKGQDTIQTEVKEEKP